MNKSIPVGGIDFAYDEHVKNGTVPLLLVHGFQLDRRIWAEVAPRLGLDRTVVSVDLPGFGQSKTDKMFTIPTLADHLVAFMDAIHHRRFILAGLSMGGYVALDLAGRYADRLAGLVIVDSKADGDNPDQKANRQRMIDLVRSQGSKAIAKEMLPNMVAPDTLRIQPHVADQLRQIMEACPAKTIETALAAMRDRPDYNAVLDHLTLPTLILVGEHDVITPPKMASSMANRCKTAEARIIPDAGHMSPMENPAVVARLIGEFAGAISH